MEVFFRVSLDPHQSQSLQKHHHRSEHWIVVSGTALALVAGEKKRMLPSDTVSIKAGQMHRLTNPSLIPLILTEVQCGDYLGEDDIVRFADLYGRTVVRTTA
ncbi:cupin domain-containing protein [Pseudomonas fluorescens]|uniref:phosphomannose isomerase type II C-terminal cupin domain n=1 Tax=Pseudomonas fluorescens TaxID=294 RepID=UPI0011323751|nr:phosphomannose isomerase type II C-terminal cupin domain [Pseudomonas fluorescens]TMU74124.1 cupin domain-containing protein [Pseudomonas fluorescens]